MSLINDMLKDLDARRHHSQGNAGVGLHGMGQAVALQPVIPLTRVVLGVGLAVALAGGGLVAWQYGSQTRSAPPDILSPASPAADVTQDQHVTLPATAIQSPVIPPTQPSVAPIVTAPEQVATTPAQVPADHHPHETTVVAGQPIKATPPVEPIMHKTVRRLSATELAELYYQQATTALQHDQESKAQALLQDALASAPDHLPARLALAGLWIQAQQHDRALELLAEGFARQPQAVDQARLYGHLLMQQGQNQRARTVLETAAPLAQQQADYQALLGTLYQRLDLPALAAQHYQRAVGLKADQALWWMGLGIAEEQLQRSAAAYEAFRTALHYPLTPSLKRYIEGRVAALRR